MTEEINIIHQGKRHPQDKIEQAYYYLMISDWGKIVIEDLLYNFDPLTNPIPQDGNPFITAFNSGTVAPIKHILENIKRMQHHPEQQYTVADTSDAAE